MKAVYFSFLIMLLVSTEVVFGQAKDSLTYPYKITGVVRDTRGNLLPGTNIISPNNENMQVADAEGKYFANINSPSTVVNFSFMGFRSFQFVPDRRTNVDIVLSRKIWRRSKMKSKGITTLVFGNP